MQIRREATDLADSALSTSYRRIEGKLHAVEERAYPSRFAAMLVSGIAKMRRNRTPIIFWRSAESRNRAIERIFTNLLINPDPLVSQANMVEVALPQGPLSVQR